MRAMILAAGLGTRMRPLSHLRPKPILPVRGVPLIAYPLAWLAHHGVREVILNLHHMPGATREAARAWAPPGLVLHFSDEPELLGTGGGIRRAAAFLRESDPSLILAGDMICDADLGALVAAHRARGDAATLLLREDPRADRFGTIGVDETGSLRRIARRFDLGGECGAGVYVSVNVIAARAFDWLPDREVFSHLDDWLAPPLARGARDVRGELVAASGFRWEPVGTPAEYLAANLRPQQLPFFDADARARAIGARIERDLVVGPGAVLGRDVQLARAVVWDGERVPDGFAGKDGVFAGGVFHPVESAEAVETAGIAPEPAA